LVERSYGRGADRVWVFRRRGRPPRAVVVFLHGLADEIESTPANHRPWLRHLAAQGDAVLYPRFETVPGAPRAVYHALKGLVAGLKAVDPPVGAPVVLIGYSRGGGLAVDLAALAPGIEVEPRAVLAVFPAMLDPPLDFRSIPPATRIVLLVGDRDTTVSHFGRDDLVGYLRHSGFAMGRVVTETVRSTPSFSATHLSALETSPGARRAFWARADRLVDKAASGPK
jgi:acetyl esterase/lipase